MPYSVSLLFYIAESRSKETKFYLVWFVNELKYAVVEGKYIEELNPKTKDKVHVKSAHGSWEGVVYTSGMSQLRQLDNCMQASKRYNHLKSLWRRALSKLK